MKWTRLVCRLTGHRWRVLACDDRVAACRGHLHSLAGCFALCTRCHAVWDDFHGCPHVAAIPEARVR